MVATMVGSLRRRVIQVNGSTLDIVIHEIKYLRDLCANKISANKAIKNRFHLSNQGESISLTKVTSSITFERIIMSLDGNVSRIKIVSLNLLLLMLLRTSWIQARALMSTSSMR
jgi:hypothetical protein